MNHRKEHIMIALGKASAETKGVTPGVLVDQGPVIIFPLTFDQA